MIYIAVLTGCVQVIQKIRRAILCGTSVVLTSQWPSEPIEDHAAALALALALALGLALARAYDFVQHNFLDHKFIGRA